MEGHSCRRQSAFRHGCWLLRNFLSATAETSSLRRSCCGGRTAGLALSRRSLMARRRHWGRPHSEKECVAGPAGEKTMAGRRWKWKERKEKEEMESLLCGRSEGAQEGNILAPKKTRIRRETHPSFRQEKEIPETIVILSSWQIRNERNIAKSDETL